jgi:hypothetical protein
MHIRERSVVWLLSLVFASCAIGLRSLCADALEIPASDTKRINEIILELAATAES